MSTLSTFVRRLLLFPYLFSSSLVTTCVDLQVLAVHDNSKQAKPERGSITWCLAYDLVYLDDDNRESEVPEEDVRPVRDTRHKAGLLMLHQKKERPGQAGGSGTAGGNTGTVDVDGTSREEVG